jgi:CDP-glucose 4,6-dehydratase
VFVTGHTGFKGTWLVRWLQLLGADVTGYALDDGSRPDQEGARGRVRPVGIRSFVGDVRDLDGLRAAMHAADPEVVFHLAAQALVRSSYEQPLATFATNVMGTVHVLDCLRDLSSARVAVLVTSDKCYANDGGDHAFVEDDELGGADPYSASKAAAELAIAAYRDSCLGAKPRLVSVRAGNVLGGGDWSRDRLVPDLVRAFLRREPAQVRLPEATRPWQFVLEALNGYLMVAEAAWTSDVPPSFNFGPQPTAAHTVGWLADGMAAQWGDGASWQHVHEPSPHRDAPTLALDATRARVVLGWQPVLDPEETVAWTAAWYRSDCDITDDQIRRFMELAET